MLDFKQLLVESGSIVQWATHSTILCYAKNSANSRPSRPKLNSCIAAIVIEGAAVTSKPTEVSGKVRTV